MSLKAFYRDYLKNEQEKIYDGICSALTNYEEDFFRNNNIDKIPYHMDEFYHILADIQNKWESVITAQTEDYGD